MLYKELILKSFGKFKDRQIELSEGINLICGENEAGKSTVSMFLKGMLYGMERGRGRAALMDNFSKYKPWDTPNDYAGIIRFESGGRIFCLERHFDKYNRSVHLFCEDDGEELSVENGDLQILLGGLEARDYENTVGIAQNQTLVGKELADEIKNFAANYSVTADTELNLNAALQNLKERKKTLEREIAEQKKELQDKKETAQLEASYVWRDIYRLEQELERTKEIQQEYQEESSRLQVQMKGEETCNLMERWRVHPIAIAVMIGMVIFTIIILEKPWNLIAGTVVFLAEALYIWNKIKGKKSKAKVEKTLNEKGEMIREKIVKNRWNQEKLLEDLGEKRVQYKNLQEYAEELEIAGSVTPEQEKQRQALKLAEDLMKEIAVDLQQSVGVSLNQMVSEIFSEITDGKYQKVWIDDDFQISVFSDGRKIEMKHLSQGTLEQLHFALRMATVKILYEEEYPVILDDTFAYYDEQRVEQTLRWLEQNVKQVIILTCQKREEELLRKNRIRYQKVEL